jgi:hypothetical protein
MQAHRTTDPNVRCCTLKAVRLRHLITQRQNAEAIKPKNKKEEHGTQSYLPTHIFSVKIAAARWMGRALKFWLSLGTVHQKQIGWTASSCGISFAWPNTVCRCTFKGIVEVRPADWRRIWSACMPLLALLAGERGNGKKTSRELKLVPVCYCSWITGIHAACMHPAGTS